MRGMSSLMVLAGCLAAACFTDSGGATVTAASGSTSAAGATTGASTTRDSSSGGDSSTEPGTGGSTSAADPTTSAADPTTSATGGCVMGGCCGNGVVEADEECDDGLSASEFCANNCRRTAYRVFVTDAEWPSGGGREGADQMCQKSAIDAGVPGNFVAWLSTSTVNAVDRVAQAGVLPILRLDAVTVVQSPAGLASGSLLAPINVNEYGVLLDLPGSCVVEAVWTGTDANGQSSGSHCEDWTLEMDGAGSLGQMTEINGDWTHSGCQIACSAAMRLYCFEVD